MQDTALRTLIALGNTVLEESELELVFARVIDAARSSPARAMRRWACWMAAASGWSAS